LKAKEAPLKTKEERTIFVASSGAISERLVSNQIGRSFIDTGFWL
jgi:hypothetical protein